MAGVRTVITVRMSEKEYDLYRQAKIAVTQNERLQAKVKQLEDERREDAADTACFERMKTAEARGEELEATLRTFSTKLDAFYVNGCQDFGCNEIYREMRQIVNEAGGVTP